ncbi:non-ribosomal peptide synthetase/type I polyketide synthase [Actinophytocola gossypii]|uniref:Amino acid adenylation domain-containing protein n=1 Tax=Actinophytocola gossypii TaxID=2812003 RepID=A0ABT2J2T6_9PSEU|nr:MupA/Atu3671 family FMN-dependent luciferase-like monooxygenase [Actinophytocola gossypii]MCT2582172.1 amino acid adenylation domain-containing protein [Actinophytocola gossypii]
MAMTVGAPLVHDEDDPPDARAALLRAAEHHPDSAVVAVTSPGRAVRLTYPELLRRARHLLAGLRTRGRRPGDAVVLHGLPLPDFFPALWACLLGGITPAVIAEPMSDDPSPAAAERFAHVCRLLRRPLVLTGAEAVDRLRATGECGSVTGVDECAAAEPADPHRPQGDDTSLLMLSSGSTGPPKAVRLTHHALAEFAASSRRGLDLRPEHTSVNWMPLDHSGALLLYHVLEVFVGATNVHAPTDLVLGDPLLWLDLLVEHRAQHGWAPNFAYQLVADALAGSDPDCDRCWDLSGIRTMVTGGEQVTVAVVSRFLDATRAFGLPGDCVRPVWGMAETTTAITLGRYTPAAVHRLLKSSMSGDLVRADDSVPDRDLVTLVSVGPPAPGAALRVVDEHDDVVPEGRVGRLQVRSPRVTPGYLGDEDGTRALFPDHERTGRTWLDSGDLAFVAGGEVVITGRVKDVIILNGHNHFCHEIEDVAGGVAGVVSGWVGACGIPDERSGTERLHVVVGTDETGTDRLVAEVRAALFERLGLTGEVVAVPRRDFPRTPSGKVRRNALPDLVRAGAARPDVEVADRVRAVLASVLGRDVDADTPFHDLGLTSVDLIRARTALSRELDREIARTAMYRYPTAAALAAHLAGGLATSRDTSGAASTSGKVAIVGMALRFPGARTPDEFWANLRDGVDSVRRFSAEEVAAAGVPARVAADPAFQPVAGALDDVSEFDHGFFGISPREAELTAPAHRLFLECCHQAMEHAGYAVRGQRVAVFAGDGMNLYGHQDPRPNGDEEGDEDGATAMRTTIGAEPDFLASRVAYRLGLTGPAVGVRTACSTSLVAVHLAARAVLSGEADLALAGAAAVRLPQEAGYRHHPGSILSPTGRCRAFDADADGTVGGNGVAAVLLKPLEAALADGDTVHAVILGSAINNDGTDKVGFSAPSVTGQVGVIREALRRAGADAGTVSYVEAHGTGTELGDPVEFDALCEAFDGVPAGSCAVGSVKPNVGHLDSCAGMAGLLKVVLMLRHRELVPTVHLRTPNPALPLAGSPFTLATERRPWTAGGRPLRAGVTALGVGGTNAHVVLEEPPARPERGPSREAVLVPVSAKDDESLTVLAGRLVDHLRSHPDLSAADVATTLALGREHLRCRLAVAGRTVAELAGALDNALEHALEHEPAPIGRLVFAFSGQDGVRPGMATELYDAFPAVRAVLDECERVRPGLLAQLRGAAVREPQSVLFAFQVALVAFWRSVGVGPDLVAGHSHGEYAAMYAAGALSIEDGLVLTTARGELLGATAPGGMLVVNADATVTAELAAASGTELAAVNGATTHVLSGSVDSVARAADLAERRRIACVRLGTDRAFHTSLVEPVLDELARHAARVGWRPLRVPMVSGLDGRVLPAGHVPDGDYVRRHARGTVRFDQVLAAVAGEDVLEVGPGEALTRLARRAGARWRPTLAGTGDVPVALLRAVGELYRRGRRIEWSAMTGSTTPGRRIPLPGHPFGSNGPSQAGPLREVRELTARLLGTTERQVDPDDTFVHLGGDSLSLMNLTRDLEERFGVRVPIRALFGDADTPRKLAELIGPRPPAATPETTTSPGAPEASEPPPARSEPESDGVGDGVGGGDVERGVDGADGGDLSALVERQLAVTERMIERVTDLMSEQLTALRASMTAPSGTPPLSTPPLSTPPLSKPPLSKPPLPAPPPSAPGERRSSADFSLYFFGDYPDEQQTDKYALITSAARFADEHGFHALWLPERHFHSFGALFPNPSVLAAALAAQTERVRLHAGSVVLPLHHPVRVAEEWSVVDNLSGGRVGICAASGWHATDFVLAPDNFGEHRELMYTHLDTVRRLWAGEDVEATSGSGDVVRVRSHPRPVQDMPPMYVAVVGNPDSYRRAAAEDLGVVTNLMAQTVDALAANVALYRRTRAEHGLDPDAGRVVVLVHTYLGDDLDRVRQEAFEPFCAYLRSSLSLFDQVTTSLGVDIDLATTPEDDVEFLLGQAYRRYCESRALIGTVDSSSAVVRQLLDAGADEIACFVDFGVQKDSVLAALPTLDTLRAAFAPGRRPLTDAERRIWFLDRLYPDQRIYHEPKAIRLTGPLDAAALQRALRHVVERQPALRTVFRDGDRDGDGEPYRLVLPDATVDCPLVDLPGATEDEALHDALHTSGRTVFDLADGPLVTARLVRLSDRHHLLFLSAHHIVFDSASTAVLVRDLAECYRTRAGLPALPPLEAGADDHAAAADVEFWRARLAGAPELLLPTDHPRRSTRSGDGAALNHELDGALLDRLTTITQAGGATLFMAALGTVAAVLGRFAGQDDVVLGTAVDNRPRDAADHIGLFLDTVPLRVDLSGDPTFTELIARVRETTVDAYDHRVPFDELVGALNPVRDAGRNPLFTVMVEFEHESAVGFTPEIAARILDVPADRAPFDLSLYLTRHAHGLRISVEYDTDLFTEGTVRGLLTHFETTLRRAVADPSAPLSALTSATDEERTRRAARQGETLPAPPCLHHLVERQVDRTPDGTAVIDGETELTFRELDERANQLANWLGARGIGRGDLVAVRLDRGADLVVALLAVLKSGAAYLPLDPQLPRARVDLVLADSGAALSLTARTLPPAADLGSASRPSNHVDPADLAYCLYTSGSSGRPKGVLVPHRGPANVVRWQLAHHPALRTLQWTSPTFDVSVQEIFGTLAAGACLVLVGDDVRHDPAAVAAIARADRVERIHMPYTPLRYLLESRPNLPDLRAVVSAGEPLVLTDAVRRFFAEHPDCLLYNQYGPTEGSIIVTSTEVDPVRDTTPSIGAPIDGVTVDVLDPHGEPAPLGAVGEIVIGGLAVADGYLGRDDETAAVFVEGPDGRRYRTGDLGRWRADGTIEFLGRRDDQVKIRGFRAEPGETQRVLADLPGVRDAAVVARRTSGGEQELVAHVVLDDGVQPDSLADRLGTLLPHYLVPHHWVAMERLPVNPNGKLDRERLPDPLEPGTADAAPETPAEVTLHELWCAETGRTSAPVDRSFFALGGHSLSAVRLLNRVGEAFGRTPSMTEFFRAPTIRALARLLTGDVVDTAPLTTLQRRLWRRHHATSRPAVYNVAHRVDLAGDLDEDALRRAVEGLVHRHAALRTRVAERDGVLVQEVLAPEPVPLPVDDLGDLDDAAVTRWCADLAGAPFVLDGPPPRRFRLGRLGHRRWVLAVVLHHMVCDGASLAILWQELAELYAAARENRDADLTPAVPHTDYARWEHTGPSPSRRAELVRYWRGALSGVDVMPALPADRPRPAALSGRGSSYDSVLPREIVDGIEAAAAELGGTPYAVLATAFATWLARACGTDAVVLAVSSANRSRPEHERVVGIVGDAVLVRVRPGAEEPVREFSAGLFGGLDHQDLPLDDVVAEVAPEHADGHFPTVRLTVVTTPPPRLALPGVESEIHGLAVPGGARAELYVRIEGDRIHWEYSTDLFTEATVAAWDADFRAVLADRLSRP